MIFNWSQIACSNVTITSHTTIIKASHVICMERYLSSNPGWLHSGRKKALVAGNRTDVGLWLKTRM